MQSLISRHGIHNLFAHRFRGGPATSTFGRGVAAAFGPSFPWDGPVALDCRPLAPGGRGGGGGPFEWWWLRDECALRSLRAPPFTRYVGRRPTQWDRAGPIE